MNKVFSIFDFKAAFWILLLVFLPFLSISAQSTYEELWNKVEQNSKQGLYKSSLPLLEQIENKAVKESNAQELIRSLKAQFNVLSSTQDDPESTLVSDFFRKIDTLSAELKGQDLLVYEVLKGEFLYEYFEQNEWRITQRTGMVEEGLETIETWSALNFKKELDAHYKSLENKKKSLELVSLNSYKSLFDNTKDLEYFPSLWMYSQLEYIDFLSNWSLFTPNERKENDKKITSIFQELQTGSSGNALLYLKLAELNWQCEQNACEDRLEKFADLLKDPTQGEYKAKIQAEYTDELIKKEEFSKALVYIEEIKPQLKGNRFLPEILQNEKEILQSSLTLTYPSVATPSLDLHFIADHKNAKELKVNIYNGTKDKEGFLRIAQSSWDEKRFNDLQKTLVRTEVIALPQTKDFKRHRTSLRLEALPPGLYVAEYSVEESERKWTYFIISKDRLLLRTQDAKEKEGSRYELVDRMNGQPLSNQKLEILETVGKESRKLPAVVSSSDGSLTLIDSDQKNRYRYLLLYNDQKGSYALMNRYGSNYYQESPSVETFFSTQLFLDRAIYRPGQRVYFKGVLTEWDQKKETSKVVESASQTLTLFDSNGQEITSEDFTTNEMGSFNGSFLLPSSVLPGQFNMQVSSKDFKSSYTGDTNYFSVEEYKRPRFELEVEDIKGEYRYGETLLLKGKALTFSGVPIADTKIQYEIKKEDIRWRYFRFFPQNRSVQNSILGEVTTDANGFFEVPVHLEKDSNSKGIQVERYRTVFSLTDQSGETQSTEKTFQVASVSHYIESSAKELYLDHEPTKVKVQLKNYSGQTLDKSYFVTLEKRKSPNRVLRATYASNVQDFTKYSREEFVKYFPYDPFDKSEVLGSYPVEKVLKKDEKKQTSELDLGRLAPGSYTLRLYNKEGNDTIKVEEHFEVYNRKRLSQEQKPFLKVAASQEKLSLDKSVELYAFSSVPNARALFLVQNGNGKTNMHSVPFKNGVAQWSVSAKDGDRYNDLQVQVQLAALDAVETKTVNLPMDRPSDSLQVETLVFRDRLEPGTKEKWSFKITYPNEQIKKTEVLATLYDESLDQFAKNELLWQERNFANTFYTSYATSDPLESFSISERIPYQRGRPVERPSFRWFDRGLLSRYDVGNTSGVVIRGQSSVARVNEEALDMMAAPAAEKSAKAESAVQEDDSTASVKVRENLNETAFFFPELQTEAKGEFSFDFTVPDALTRWKLQILAHTKNMQTGRLEKQVVTEKKLSISPNYPRFLRAGDEVVLRASISNRTKEALNGEAGLEIIDARSGKNLNQEFGLKQATAAFSLLGEKTSAVSFSFKVPENTVPVLLRFSAKSSAFTDAEQKMVPVISNRKLVTESRAILVRSQESKSYEIPGILSGNSTTVVPVAAHLELVTQPIWEILFALPSLKNDTYKSADVQFNKWFSDVIAMELFEKNPKLEQIFNKYRSSGQLISDLEKNQELKEVLLQETPWVMEAKNEKEQMERISRLFDLSTMNQSVVTDWRKLQEFQNPDGGFSWYPGLSSSYFTSLELLKNLGRLQKLIKTDLGSYAPELSTVVSRLIEFTDSEIGRYVQEPSKYYYTNTSLNYLDARRYWEKTYPLKGYGKQIKDYLVKKIPSVKLEDYTFYGLHRVALLSQHYGLSTTSTKLLTYLKDTSVESELQGRYWKSNLSSWSGRESKVSNHAGALEAFQTLKPSDKKLLEELKIWLLTQKNVGGWDSSRSTAEVIFLMLESGASWEVMPEDQTHVVWGGESLKKNPELPGYVKESRTSEALNPLYGKVEITQSGNAPVMGGLFVQYYEDLDKIQASSTVVRVEREHYRVKKTVNGEQLDPLTLQSPLKVGDRIRVRIILNTDRPMEFMHLRDQRAAGMEPVEALSGYRYNHGLGYYQAQGDTATDFFIERLSKGKHVFEYDLVANAEGIYSLGVATLQNYYAPEMTSSSKGGKTEIEPMK